eukprot:3944195-Alexandrium_andersonii.AAC.1
MCFRGELIASRCGCFALPVTSTAVYNNVLFGCCCDRPEIQHHSLPGLLRALRQQEAAFGCVTPTRKLLPSSPGVQGSSH